MNYARAIIEMGPDRRNELQGTIETFGPEACLQALEGREEGPLNIARLLLLEVGYPVFSEDFELSDDDMTRIGQDLIDAGIYLAGEGSLHVTKT